MRFGYLAASDASFRAVCMLLSGHAMYADVPLKRTADIYRAVTLQQAFAAADEHGRLCGVALWRELSDESAMNAVARRTLPTATECQEHGEAVVAVAFLANSVEASRLLWRAFVRHHAGKTILYERHKPGKSVTELFKWIDKTGRQMGPNV